MTDTTRVLDERAIPVIALFAATLVLSFGWAPAAAVLVFALTGAAIHDAAESRIPNLYSAAAVLAAVMVMPLVSSVGLVYAAIFGVGMYVLWEMGLMGGGDVKLFIPTVFALTVFVGWSGATLFLTATFTLSALYAIVTNQRHVPVAAGALVGLMLVAVAM